MKTKIILYGLNVGVFCICVGVILYSVLFPIDSSITQIAIITMLLSASLIYFEYYQKDKQ